jgi:hypothetical protein
VAAIASCIAKLVKADERASAFAALKLATFAKRFGDYVYARVVHGWSSHCIIIVTHSGREVNNLDDPWRHEKGPSRVRARAFD